MIIVSVVVPTCRRAPLLERCLQALANQDYDPREYEIIVADDAADYRTRLLVEDYAAQRLFPAVRYLPMSRQRGPAAARNRGWRIARGRIIAFTDDDCIPLPDWISAGASLFGAGAAGVSGRIIVPVPDRPHDYARTTAGLAGAEFATANCFYRRDVLASLGGFDERFTAAWREDADLFFSLLERGQRAVFSREAVVIHPVRPAGWGVSLREQKKSMFNALLYKKHPVLYRERIPRSFPADYYAAVLSFAAGTVAAAGGYDGMGLVFAGIWIGATALFLRRRLADTSREAAHVAEMVITSALIPFLSVYWRLRGAMKFRVLFL